MKKDEERHVLTLREAHRLWGEQKQYRVLYNRTNVSFRDTWAALDLDKPCAHYTLEVLGAAIMKGRGLYQNMVKASSIMQHVLNYAHVLDAEHCPAPRFSYGEIAAYAKSVAQPKVQAVVLETKKEKAATKSDVREKRQAFKNRLMKKTQVEVVLRAEESKAVVEEIPEVAAIEESEKQVTCDISQNINIKTEETMKENKVSNLAKKVVQIDPETMKPIKTWDSISLAQRECNVRNIGRAITSRSAAGGYFWCFAGDEGDFNTDKKARKYKPRKKNVQKPRRERKENVAKPANETAGTESPMNLPVVIEKTFDVTQLSDDELIAEIRRRGWKGDLDVVKRITL